ncbi:MAG TPA: hypothetical protein VHN78_14755, partial [Chloroflexota bacterium]|nr:hypothetical protein [Chloroflexota bacterium]
MLVSTPIAILSESRSTTGGLTWPALGIPTSHDGKDAPYQPNQPKLSALRLGRVDEQLSADLTTVVGNLVDNA